MTKKPSKSDKRKQKPVVRDLHYLYECSVQSTDADLDFAEKVYKRRHGSTFRLLREDFCGTAALACTWVLRHPENRAIGVDLDRPTLEWGETRNLAALGDARSRVELFEANVLEVQRPKADVTMALNFSYWIFKQRAQQLEYFKSVRRGLKPGGLFILDLFGGTESMVESDEDRKIDAEVTFDGTRVPGFKYSWEQAEYNPVTGDFVCHIHFKLRDGTRMKKAFSYDWRFWTMPELRELLMDAGFEFADAYTDDWDDFLDDSDGIYRRRRKFDNEGVWVGYLVAGR